MAWLDRLGHMSGECHSHTLYSNICDRTQSRVNGQTTQTGAFNGQKWLKKDGQHSHPSAERTQITVLQFSLNWNGLQQYYVGEVTYVRTRIVLSMV